MSHAVLVVDDDADRRSVLMDWVAQSGFAPVEADAPDRALERLDDTGTAIALCNVAMPGDRGVTLARAIRERCATTAIIVSTSLPDIDVAVSSLENGVVDYLLAPFDQVRLGEALSLAIDWHRASLGAQQLQDSIQDRLRARRTMVAAALAEAQSSSEDTLDGLIAMLQLHEKDSRGHATRVLGAVDAFLTRRARSGCGRRATGDA